MTFAFSLTLLLCCMYSVQCLRCMTCKEASYEECRNNQVSTECHERAQSCETIIRRRGVYQSPNYATKFIKRCKSAPSCQNNPAVCGRDLYRSICRCCCSTDNCNTGFLSCADLTDFTCPAQTDPLQGVVTCTDGHSEGSTCSVTCNSPDYFPFPADLPNSGGSTCLQSGKWDQSPPCCARPCPPYFLGDIITIYHASNQQTWEKMLYDGWTLAVNTSMGADSVKFGILYHSGVPHVNDAVFLNEYGDGKWIYFAMVQERVVSMNNSADGLVNTGAAMEFVMNNMFTEAAGARNKNVPKVVMVVTDQASNDDVVGPAEEMRRRGILTYALGYESDEADLNMEQLNAIAGEPDHVFISSMSMNPLKLLAEMTQHFCTNPCDFVMDDSA